MKYLVTQISDKDELLQEATFKLIDDLNNDNDRYIAKLSVEAQDFVDRYDERFIFDSYPTLQEVRDRLYEVVKEDYGYIDELYIKSYLDIYDTKNNICLKNNFRVNYFDDLLLSYNREYKICHGDILSFKVKEIKYL